MYTSSTFHLKNRMMSNLKQFRYDINGLRAYAVILVVLFHFQILGFSAGFIGVDIFFVISGYLMTKIIIDQILQNKFSIIKFYLARAVRILPALLVLTTAVAAVSWFILIPEEYKNYGKHAASSITFLSNILYWRESSDYFSAAAHDKILLHTWSLSVEWQFYIILPIILVGIGKIKKSRSILNLAVLVGFVVSLVLSYKVSQTSQTTAFYMIPTRAWEMLAGGLVYSYFSQISLSNIVKKGIEILGFLLILISLIIFETDTLWPSINALLPVLGSMLILTANNNDSIFTQSKIFQWAGNTSYSIYLWHWPIVFYIGYLGLQQNTLVIILGIILSLILGWLGYKFIETPTRKYLSKISVLKSYSILILITAILTAVFALIFIKNGIPERANQRYLESAKKVAMPLPKNGWCFYSVDSISSLEIGEKVLDCKIGTKENIKHTALLFGDSFAGHNIPFWNDVGNKLDTQVQAVTTNWCYPSLGEEYTGLKTSRAFEQCQFNRKYLDENMAKYDYLIFSGHWRQVQEKGQLHNFDMLLAKANKLGIPVVIMASPYAFNKNIGNEYKRAIWLNREFSITNYANNDFDALTAKSNTAVKEIASKYTNVFFIDRKSLYSDKHLSDDGFPYSLDGGHISILGSEASAKYFEKSKAFQDLKARLK